jgi:GntR family transcriptional regulator
VTGRPLTVSVAVMDFSGIHQANDMHMYLRIAAVIEAEIAKGTRGELPPGATVPSEQQLIGETGAARNTVRHAIASLRDRGLLYTVPHLGTFVSRGDPA